MATYAFKAVDLAGVPQRGELDADDKQTVAMQLRSRGLIVTDIEELKPTDVGDLLARWRRVKAGELTVATRQLSTMVSSGMSILRAFYDLERLWARVAPTQERRARGRSSRIVVSSASRRPT